MATSPICKRSLTACTFLLIILRPLIPKYTTSDVSFMKATNVVSESCNLVCYIMICLFGYVIFSITNKWTALPHKKRTKNWNLFTLWVDSIYASCHRKELHKHIRSLNWRGKCQAKQDKHKSLEFNANLEKKYKSQSFQQSMKHRSAMGAEVDWVESESGRKWKW